MLKFIDKIPYLALILVAIFMALSPFYPMPHVMEKIIMLKNGNLNRAWDIFDLFYHLFPAIILIIKWRRDLQKK